jgi:hypothetical protein
VIGPARASWRQRWVLVLRFVPLLLLILSYAWLSVSHGTPWLWNVPVHESGHYTLGETVLFVRHHLREIPVDVAMALSLAAAIRVVSAPSTLRPVKWPIWCALILTAGSFAASAAQEGAGEALRDVLQYRTRDDDVGYGSHWRFHFLSTIWFAVAAALLAAVSTGTGRVLRAKRGSAGRRLNAALWGYIILLTVAFGFTTEPFTSNRYVGHQAREILTHGLITLPLVFSLAWRPDTDGAGPDAERSILPVTVTAWLLVIAIPVFLAVAFAQGGLEETAQLSSGLAGVVAGHVFEHVLDYVLVALLTLSFTGVPRRRTM